MKRCLAYRINFKEKVLNNVYNMVTLCENRKKKRISYFPVEHEESTEEDVRNYWWYLWWWEGRPRKMREKDGRESYPLCTFIHGNVIAIKK